jgi:sulfoxide reductase catalytic subunit YedY
MRVHIRAAKDIRSSKITPEHLYLNRRRFLERTSKLAVAAALGPGFLAACDTSSGRAEESRGAARGSTDGPGRGPQERDWSLTRSDLGEALTSYEDVTTYNNFYEFGTAKEDPAKNAHVLRTRPWSVAVEGHVARPAVYDLEDFIAPHRLEDRIYRLRCVEAWSMVIPWRGFPLAELVRRVEPTGNARFVEFTTLLDPEQMPAQRRGVLELPACMAGICPTRMGRPFGSSCPGSMASRASSRSSASGSWSRCRPRLGSPRRRTNTASSPT